MGMPLLSPPPLSHRITDRENVSTPYQKYFTNLNATLSATLVPVPFVSDQTGTQSNSTVIQLPLYTTAEINSMNAPDGVLVYDTTINAAKLRVSGAWKEVNVT